jgi:hypothetical protein
MSVLVCYEVVPQKPEIYTNGKFKALPPLQVVTCLNGKFKALLPLQVVTCLMASSKLYLP